MNGFISPYWCEFNCEIAYQYDVQSRSHELSIYHFYPLDVVGKHVDYIKIVYMSDLSPLLLFLNCHNEKKVLNKIRDIHTVCV